MKNNVVLSRKNRRALKALFQPYAKPSRHSGQALLLVVLIMLVAALISAGFLGIISGNLNQTSRIADNNKATQAAQAGLFYVNQQLTNSADGENWFSHNYETGTDPLTARNAASNPALLDTAAANPFYYSELDKVQGWAGNYAKFPDPNGKPSSSTPKFLARVDRVPTNITDKTNPEYIHQGQIKITVIGLSEDDPNVWHRSVSYKGGYAGSPVGQVMRTISAWDYDKSAVPVAKAGTYTPPVVGTSAATLAIAGRTASFGEAPFGIVIGNPVVGSTLQNAVVTKVSTDGNTLTLAAALNAAPSAGDRIEIASAIGSPDGSLSATGSLRNTVDFLNDLTISDTNDNNASAYQVSRIPTTYTQLQARSGMRINGSGLYFGSTDALNLLSPGSAYSNTGNIPATVQASGLIALGNTSSSIPVPSNVGIQGDTMMAAVDLQDSTNSAFPATGIAKTLVNDGWDRLNNTPGSSIRAVKPFTPPNFVSGSGMARYRDLTQNSQENYQSVVPNFAMSDVDSSSSRYGYGKGIYIDNRSDREKYTVGTTLKEMPQDILERMWTNSPELGGTTIPIYGRTPTAASIATRPVTYTAGPVSLEEQHVRGWISPTEFLPRGVLIEILADNTLRVTRDARDDNTPGVTPVINATGPVASKAWVDPATGNTVPGNYTRIFNWPANGVIFAEGNVRIVSQPRTNAAIDPPCSLTVVSMNNIYIDGQLSLNRPDTAGTGIIVNPRKLVLMARKNVVLNPTRVLGQPDVQSVVTTATPITLTAGTAAAVPVVSAAGFNPGDRVRFTSGVFGSETISSTAIVNSVTGNQLTVTPDTTSAVSNNAIVRVPLENAYNTNAASPDVYYSAVGKAANVAGTGIDVTASPIITEAVTRRVQTPGVVPNGLRYAFDHVAERKVGLTVGTTILNGTPQEAFFRYKRYMTPADSATQTNWQQADVVQGTATASDDQKLLRADWKLRSSSTDAVDAFPATPPADDATALTASIQAQSTLMNSTTHAETLPDQVGFQYDTTAAAGFSGAPFYYLAGVGQRNYNYNTADATPSIPASLTFASSSGTDWRKDILTGGKKYDVPMATSVGLFFGGSLIPQILANQSSTGATYQTSFFGFNPNYITTSSGSAYPEDVTTSDQSFYRPDGAIADSLLDSRTLGATLTAGAINSLVMQPSSGLSATVNAAAANFLPQYRLRNIKLEQADVDGTSGAVTALRPGTTINVDAYVVAQEGSWFVIPGGYFRDKALVGTTLTGVDTSLIRGTDATHSYYDFDNSGTLTPGGRESVADGAGYVPDFNRNGIADPDERLAVARYFRYNYQINFTGAISENRSAIVEDTGTDQFGIKGAVADWTNKWATVTYPSGGTLPFKYDVINYTFDPDYALGKLTDKAQITPVNSAATATRAAMVGDYDFGFQMPQSPDLSYTE